MSELRPEQIAALEYLRRKGTEASAERLRGQVAAAFSELEALLATVPAALRTVRPGPARWSVQEVVNHLVLSHRPAVEQLRSLVAGTRPLSPAIPASLQSEDGATRAWDDLRSELAAVHRDFKAAADSASDQTSLRITAPVVLVVKAATADGALAPVAWEHECDWKAYVQTFRVHTLEHRKQIQKTLADLGAPVEVGSP